MAQVEFNVPGPGTYLIEADPSLPPLAQPGTAADVLTGEQFYDEEGNAITGTMPSNPAEAVVIPGGGSYTIPQGYHTGQGTVTSSGSVLPTLTDPADAGEIVSGKQAIDQNGGVLTGTMPSNPAISETLEAGESYQVPAGYTPGGTVQAASLSYQTPGTATQDDIIQGQTAWVNGVQITGALEPGTDPSDATATAEDILEGETAYVATGKVQGTMPNNGAVQQTLQAGGQYTIPAGHHNGQGTVTAQSLADQTTGTATAPDILDGKTAWVNGAQVTGSMPDNGAVTKEMTAGETYTIPAGYHNGSGTVTAPTVASETPGTAVAGDIRQGKTAWVDGEQLTGTVPDVEAATPTISVSPEGLITAQTEQTAGYVAEATKAASQQLQTLGAQTITPGAQDKTIQSNVYLTGTQTIQGDAALVPDNIKDGVSIFGVEGTYDGQQTSFAIPLVVTVEAGSTVIAENSGKRLTALSDGTATILLNAAGTWTFYAEKGALKTSTQSITIPEQFDEELSFTKELVYYGTAEALIQRRNSFAATTVGNYALFGGGYTGSESAVVDAYDEGLTRTTPTALSEGRSSLAATTIGGYALFGGGATATYSSVVDAYDETLTRTTPEALSQARRYLAATVVGGYALFGGGYSGGDRFAVVDAYNESLTRTTPTALSQARSELAATTIGGYALFGGGAPSSSTYSAVVDAYDEGLTRTTPTALSRAYSELAATTIGGYALFGGWYVDAYDEGLTRTTPTALSQARSELAATTIGGYALFGGGAPSSSTYSAVVDAYDEGLTRTTPTALSEGRRSLAATMIGGYALFGGGFSSVKYSAVVDAYTTQ